MVTPVLVGTLNKVASVLFATPELLDQLSNVVRAVTMSLDQLIESKNSEETASGSGLCQTLVKLLDVSTRSETTPAAFQLQCALLRALHSFLVFGDHSQAAAAALYEAGGGEIVAAWIKAAKVNAAEQDSVVSQSAEELMLLLSPGLREVVRDDVASILPKEEEVDTNAKSQKQTKHQLDQKPASVTAPPAPALHSSLSFA